MKVASCMVDEKQKCNLEWHQNLMTKHLKINSHYLCHNVLYLALH